MSTTDALHTQKQCWNCQQSVQAYAIQCPHCGAELGAVADIESSPYQHVPYSAQEERSPTQDYSIQSAPIPEAPYSSSFRESPQESLLPREDSWNSSSEEVGSYEEEQMWVQQEIKRDLKPLLLLLPGAVFFVFGLILLFFSHDGVFVLRWNSAFWPFYLLLSLPLLYFGWRALGAMEES